jgi:hypothetical protein
MRQIFLLLSILLLGLSWAVAQDSTSGQTSRTGAGGQMTVEGCLSGSNGNFTLTDKNGMAYQLTGDTAKLTEHVGHEIKVTGTSASAGTGEPSGTAGSAGAGQALQVTSVKHIAKSCKSGGMVH